MNTSNILKILDTLLNCSKVRYWDVLGLDEFQRFKPTQFPSLIIFNEQIRKLRGSHWLLAYFPSQGQFFFYDTYGKLAQDYKLRRKPKFYNRKQHQAAWSDSCGQFTVFVAHKLSIGYSFKKALSFFTRDKNRNDRLVRSFVENLNVTTDCKAKGQICTCRNGNGRARL